jgi:H+/gluconate symporter-like permease
MNTIPEVLTPAVVEQQANTILDVLAIVCGLGAVMAACMATSGLDMSLGFF